jgi:dipeptidyl aminopeptidase/acylaminoacyl peptidase
MARGYHPFVRSPSRALAVLCLSLLLTGCLNHYVYHPRRDPPEVRTWSEQVVRGRLLIRLEWAKPEGPGPFPTVVVHPEANHVAREMRGVVRDLARAGYLAVAADYRRKNRLGLWRDTLFTWKDPDDPRAVYDLVRARPEVDADRLAFLGFSQGGVYSLLIAAYTQGAAAVVAYYPVTDFERWLEEAGGTSRGRRFVFRLIRKGFQRASGAKTEAEFRTLLGRASPYRQAEAIRAPVLLVHGDRDTSAGVAESERLAARLRELGGEVELEVIPDAGHVFNFRDRGKAEAAWRATREFLDRHLQPSSR